MNTLLNFSIFRDIFDACFLLKDFVESCYTKHMPSTKCGTMGQDVSSSSIKSAVPSTTTSQSTTITHISQPSVALENIVDWVGQAYQTLKKNKVSFCYVCFRFSNVL